MSRRAERWVAEQEIAVLEAMYERQSPPEPQDRHPPIRLEPQTVKSRPRSDRS